ncbi:MAG: hypothetical protein WD003_00080 [Candidatus Paceibacterota bacterium]
MEKLLTIAHVFIGDVTIFLLLQGFILGVFIYSATHHIRRKKSKKITTLKASDLVLAYSLISASLIQAISSVDILTQFKLGIILTNLVASFYLCFFSLWFQGFIADISLKIGRSAVRAS